MIQDNVGSWYAFHSADDISPESGWGEGLVRAEIETSCEAVPCESKDILSMDDRAMIIYPCPSPQDEDTCFSVKDRSSDRFVVNLCHMHKHDIGREHELDDSYHTRKQKSHHVMWENMTDL